MYQFKLEALLNHRRNQKEAAQKELAKAWRKLAAEREKLDQKKKEKQENIDKLHAKEKNPTNASDISLYLNYIRKLSKDIEDQGVCVHNTANLVDRKREALIAVMQKHKILTKLKSKQRRAFEQKLIQDERKLMDELASIRHARKS
jgi:flagellar export protein FliJ